MSAREEHCPAVRPGTYGDDQLHTLQRNTFRYFWEETNPENGLIPDNTSAGDVPASIAGVGFALASYPVAVERSFVSRAQAVERTLATLRFFWNAPQGPMPDATGHRGFFYHFLDVTTGRRAWRCELSTIDTTILVAGALTAAAYFDQATDDEREVRRLADSLYRRVDWQWAQNGEATVSHGWKPETGFLRYSLAGIQRGADSLRARPWLADAPLAREELSWPGRRPIAGRSCTATNFSTARPLFMHQLSHLWIDFRGIQDAFMRRQAIDYFENSRRATYVNQQYAHSQSEGLSRLWPARLGHHRQQRPGAGDAPRERSAHGASLGMSREACRMVRTMARWLRGRSPRRCRSLLRSCFPPCSTAPRRTRRWKTSTGSSAASIRRFRVAVPEVSAGSRKTTSRSIRGRSF